MFHKTGRMAAVAALAAMSATAAHASGFAVKESSASAQGSGFAGATAGGDDITYASFNPAALRNVKDLQFAFSNSYIGATIELDTPEGKVDGDREDVFAGAFFIGKRLSEDLVVGGSVYAPYGLVTEYQKGWYGELSGINTDLKTFAFTAMASYDVNPQLTFGVGVQYLYGRLTFENAALLGVDGNGAPVVGNQELVGDGDAFGFTVGALYDATPSTTIGVAYRHGYNFEGSGDIELISPTLAFNPFTGQPSAAPGLTVLDADASADLPPLFSIGISHDVSDKFTLLGEFQWQGWSTLDFFTVEPAGADVSKEEFGYEDSIFIAFGGSFQVDEDLTLRAGVSYDTTPVPDSLRSPRVPDGDRVGLSGGASYVLMAGLKVDVAYTFLNLVEKEPVNVEVLDPTSPQTGFIVEDTIESSGSAHIFSLGASYDF